MIPLIHSQILNLKESATLSINQKALSMRKQGVDICHLGFGESPFPVPEIMVESLKEYSSKKNYLPGMGLPELRDTAASFFRLEYELDSSRENTVVGPGSKELIFHLLMLLEGPFIIPAPSWVTYGPQAHILSKPVHTVSTERKNSYRLHAGELNVVCNNLGTGQKILILNNPCNPTGAVYPPHELEELAQVCRDQNVVVISDEIYALIDFSGRKFVSISKFYPEGTLVTGGLSKAFSAGGWRLGLTFVPKAMSTLIKPWNALISETYSCVSAPIQYGALAAFENFEEIRPQIDQCCDIHSLAGSYLHRRFIKMNLNCPKPEGAFYLFPDFQNHQTKLNQHNISDCAQLTENLLKNAKVAVLPGNDFYMNSENLCVRVASVDYSGPDVLKHFPGLENCSDAWVEKQMPNLKLACDRIQDWIS